MRLRAHPGLHLFPEPVADSLRGGARHAGHGAAHAIPGVISGLDFQDFAEAVAEDQSRAPGGNDQLLLIQRRDVEQSQGLPDPHGHGNRPAGAIQEQRWRMAGTRVHKTAGAGVQHAVEQGDEHA